MSRAKGANAIEWAACYAATALHDPGSGRTYDYSNLTDVAYREIIGPSEAGEWWQDRQVLWQAAEGVELRRNACVAREWQLGLPYELSFLQRIELARRWAIFVVTRYGCAVDLTVHTPPPDGDPRNHYAKLLATTRQVNVASLGDKTSIEKRYGEKSGPQELRLLHQLWRQMVDEILQGTVAA